MQWPQDRSRVPFFGIPPPSRECLRYDLLLAEGCKCRGKGMGMSGVSMHIKPSGWLLVVDLYVKGALPPLHVRQQHRHANGTLNATEVGKSMYA